MAISMSLSMSPKMMLGNKPCNANVATPKLGNMVTYTTRSATSKSGNMVTYTIRSVRPRRMIAVRAAPDKLSDNVEKSIQEAQETCSDDPVSSECVAAWDVVEEVSAAASHARDKAKDTDPLEEYCKDNPETEECKTYDN